MEFPLGMLIYSAHRQSDENAQIIGMWYYKEMLVPTSIAEKKQSLLDFKNKRCLFIDVVGSFSQICDLLMQTDKFHRGRDGDINQFAKLRDQLISSPTKPVLFDDLNNTQGKALSLDTICTVDETQEEILEQIYSPKKMVFVTISKEWSWLSDINKASS